MNMRLSYFLRVSAQRWLILSLLALFLGTAPDVRAQPSRWAGYPIQPGWAVTTPESFLGNIYVRTQLGQNADEWIVSASIGSWFYLPEQWVGAAGTWAYSVDLDESLYDHYWADQGWLYARSNGAWVWVHDTSEALSAGHGWVFVHYGELLPEDFVVTSAFTAEPPVDDLDLPGYTNARLGDADELVRLAGALRIGPDEMEGSLEMDAGVTLEKGSDGFTFTNTASSGNRFVRILYHPVTSGLIDFSALDAYTGKVSVTVRADIDLSAATGGFYSRMKNRGLQAYVDETPGIPDHVLESLVNLTDAGAFSRVASGIVQEDVLLEQYANEWTDPVFIELTIPGRGQVTVKEIFLHMDTEIRGFAGMAERITGGAGATVENTHTVGNVAEMLAALEAVRAADGPSIIYVDGTLTLEDWEAAGGDANRQFGVSDSIRDLSIIGVGDNGLLDGLGFKVHGANIIFRNLTIRDLWMRNAFEVNNGRYVLITQCTMHGDADPSTRFDEMLSVKNDARYVIISWNHFHTDVSGRSILMGSNDGVESLPDRKVIIHHNWFQNIGTRHPLMRGGYAHMYNNYLSDGISRGANIRTRARMRIENNYFENVDRAIFPGEEPEIVAGRWEVAGNIYEGGNSNFQPTESTVVLNFESDYTYTLDPAEDVPAIVMAGAGAGKEGEPSDD